MELRQYLIASIMFTTSLLYASRSFFIDSVNGNDSNDGLTFQTAWASFTKINQTELAPGDQVFLVCGSVWNERLCLKGNGTANAPISITSFGTGRRPYIQTENTSCAILMADVSHMHVSGLEISNRQPLDYSTLPATIDVYQNGKNVLNQTHPNYPGYARKKQQTGILAQWLNCGAKEDISITDMHIHDVEGRQDSKENGGIVIQIDGKEKSTCLIGLEISRNRLERVCRSGIVFKVWPHARRNNWFPSRNVHIAGNTLTDIGGDGIIPWACDGAVVEYNTLIRSGCTANESNAGIWPWSCSNTLIRRNLVAFTCKHSGNGDGQGYDVDTNNRNTIVEENLSYRNAGGFILICGEKPDDKDLNSRIIVRNNISISDGITDWGDGSGIFTLWNNLEDVFCYNNTIAIPENGSGAIIANWHSPIPLKNVNFFNNAIFTARNLYIIDRQEAWSLRNNLFITPLHDFSSPFGNRDFILSDTLFTIPSINPDTHIPPQLSTFTRFRFPDCITAEIPNNDLAPDRDFFGEPVTANHFGAIATH